MARWRLSKLSVRAFCAAEQLSEASFYAWRRELAERARERSTQPLPTFLPVQVAAAETNVRSESYPQPTTAVVEILLPSGHVLRVSPGCDRATLATVLGVLEQRPC